MALQTCAVSVTVNAPDGSPVTNAIIVAELSERVMQEGVLIPERVVKRTDSHGQATLDLWPNSLVDDPQTYYIVIISTPQGSVETFYITVPEATSANMRDLERINIPIADKDEAARLVASVARIEQQTKQDLADSKAALQEFKQYIADLNARIKEPDYWEGSIEAGKSMYPLAGATISEPKFYDVVINGIPQRPTIDYKIHINEADLTKSEIELIGNLPTGRNWWALIRSVVTRPTQ